MQRKGTRIYIHILCIHIYLNAICIIQRTTAITTGVSFPLFSITAGGGVQSHHLIRTKNEPPRAAVPPVAKLLAHHHLALPASTFTDKRLAEKATQALRRKCEVRRHNRKESEEKEEARSSKSFGITSQGVGTACSQSSLAPSQNSISKDTGVRTFVHLCRLQ